MYLSKTFFILSPLLNIVLAKEGFVQEHTYKIYNPILKSCQFLFFSVPMFQCWNKIPLFVVTFSPQRKKVWFDFNKFFVEEYICQENICHICYMCHVCKYVLYLSEKVVECYLEMVENERELFLCHKTMSSIIVWLPLPQRR